MCAEAAEGANSPPSSIARALGRASCQLQRHRTHLTHFPKQMARRSFGVSGVGVQKPWQGSYSPPKSRAEELSLLSNSDYFPKTHQGLCDTLDERQTRLRTLELKQRHIKPVSEELLPASLMKGKILGNLGWRGVAERAGWVETLSFRQWQTAGLFCPCLVYK